MIDHDEFITLKEKHRNGYPNHTITPDDRQAERERIANDTEAFLSRGGQITEVGTTKPYEHPATYSISRKRWAD